MQSIAILTPYELIPGGGERYVLSVAEAFREAAQVFLVAPEALPKDQISNTAEALGVSGAHLIPLSVDEAFRRRPFDFAVHLQNEIVPAFPALGTKSVMICQFPFPFPDAEATRRMPNFTGYHGIVVYSDYSRKHAADQLLRRNYPALPLHIISPPVDRVRSDAGVRRRRGMIVSVGRFFEGAHSKRQDALIDCFRALSQRVVASLHLAGAVSSSAQGYFEACVKSATGLPVHFYPNASRRQIGALYQEAECYWHGAGLDADPVSEPERFEHFGITVVEAMATGCIPFAFCHGGPASTIGHGRSGWLYRSANELVEMTSAFLMRSAFSPGTWVMRQRAKQEAASFSSGSFRTKWKELYAALA